MLTTTVTNNNAVTDTRAKEQDRIVLARLSRCDWQNPTTGKVEHGVVMIETGNNFSGKLAAALNITDPELMRELSGVMLRLANRGKVEKVLIGANVTHVKYISLD